MSKNNTVATPQEKETTQEIKLNKKGNPKGERFTPRTTPRNQHPKPAPEKKEPAEIKLHTEGKYKIPNGKVVTLEEREKHRKAQEEEYKNFRIKALRRRAKRQGLSDEDTEKAVKALQSQLDCPNDYNVLLLFNPNNIDMIREALKKEGLVWKILSGNYCYLEADQDTLATIRSIVTPDTKVHPYVKKKPPILPAKEQPKSSKKPRTKAEKKALAKAAKKARKALNRNKGHNVKSEAKVRLEEFMRKWKADKVERKGFKKSSHKAVKKAAGTVVHLSRKKPSASPKTASMSLKQAA